MTVLLQKDAGRFLFLSFLFDSTENEEYGGKRKWYPGSWKVDEKKINQTKKQTNY